MKKGRKGGKSMQMCGECERVYDESEYSKCPYCHKQNKTYAEALKFVRSLNRTDESNKNNSKK